jgi:hypothetical protein
MAFLVAAMAVVLVFLVGGLLVWVSTSALKIAAGDKAFAYASMTLISLTMLRYLAMLIGAAMVFGGLMVSFFTHSRASKLEVGGTGGSSSGKVALATASPGIASIVVGAIVIVAALFSQGHFKYTDAEVKQARQDPATATGPVAPELRADKQPPSRPAGASVEVAAAKAPERIERPVETPPPPPPPAQAVPLAVQREMAVEAARRAVEAAKELASQTPARPGEATGDSAKK